MRMPLREASSNLHALPRLSFAAAPCHSVSALPLPTGGECILTPGEQG